MSASLRHRWRVRSLRFRILAATTVAAGIALLLALGAYALTLNAVLDNSARAAATDQAAQVAALIAESDADPATTLRQVPARGSILQLVDSSGKVVSSNDSAAADRPVADLRPNPGQTLSTRTARLPGDDPDPYVVAARGLSAKPGHPASVLLVANPLRTETLLIKVASVGLGALALLLLLGLLWLMSRVLGTALGRVERIRASVAQIRATRSDTRVPVPPGDDEITHLAQTMNDMLDRLHRADRTQRAFVSDASHELRSPLTAIRVVSESPGRGIDEAGARIVRAEVVRMQRLVDDLLTLAKADDRGVVLRHEEVDVDDLLLQEIHRLRAVDGVNVVGDIAAARVVGDRDRLAQVVRNLADNAVRHARTTVRLASGSQGDSVLITVDNDGPVIAADHREAVFDRFVRLQDARERDSGGSGLGLAIVGALVEAHGGRVEATDSPQGWCRFEVRLPAQR